MQTVFNQLRFSTWIISFSPTCSSRFMQLYYSGDYSALYVSSMLHQRYLMLFSHHSFLKLFFYTGLAALISPIFFTLTKAMKYTDKHSHTLCFSVIASSPSWFTYNCCWFPPLHLIQLIYSSLLYTPKFSTGVLEMFSNKTFIFFCVFLLILLMLM